MFFFFKRDNIDVCLPQILTQKLSVYIRDNSVNLYRERDIEKYSPDYLFPSWAQSYTAQDIQYVSTKMENIANYHLSQRDFGEKKGEYGLFLIIQSKKLESVSDAFSYSFFLSLSLFSVFVFLSFVSLCMHVTRTCVCVLWPILIFLLLICHTKRMHEKDLQPTVLL